VYHDIGQICVIDIDGADPSLPGRNFTSCICIFAGRNFMLLCRIDDEKMFCGFLSPA